MILFLWCYMIFCGVRWLYFCDLIFCFYFFGGVSRFYAGGVTWCYACVAWFYSCSIIKLCFGGLIFVRLRDLNLVVVHDLFLWHYVIIYFWGIIFVCSIIWFYFCGVVLLDSCEVMWFKVVYEYISFCLVICLLIYLWYLWMIFWLLCESFGFVVLLIENLIKI